MEKRQNELRDLLQEGVAALREIRRGMGNACADLRDLYRNMPAGNPEAEFKKYGEQFRRRNNTANPADRPSISME
jgi:hypothetical protein